MSIPTRIVAWNCGWRAGALTQTDSRKADPDSSAAVSILEMSSRGFGLKITAMSSGARGGAGETFPCEAQRIRILRGSSEAGSAASFHEAMLRLAAIPKKPQGNLPRSRFDTE
jgi:hypothetical protein